MKYSDLIQKPVMEASEVDDALEENLSMNSSTAPMFHKQKQVKERNTAKLKRWSKEIRN